MLECKTTKEIIVDELNFDESKSLTSIEFCKSVDECPSLRVIWCHADRIKKEIEDYIIKKGMQGTLLADEMRLCFNDVCQNVSNLCEKDINAKDSGNGNVAVSCEQKKAGEDKGNVDSSILGRRGVQKKCTCNKSVALRNFERNTKGSICVGCGGRL